MKQSPHYKFNKKPLVVGIAAAMLSLAATNANAVKFQLGDFDVSFDSTFSLGTSIRVENRDWDTLIGKSNNLNNGFDFSNYNAALNANPNSSVIWQGAGGYTNNADNGNLNYDAGQAFSTVFKGLHELDINNGTVGLFVRGMYYYDFETMDSDRPWRNPTSGNQSSPCRDSESRSLACQDVRLLDAFVYGDFEVGGMPLSVRVGDQVINWGESTFISHGISELNPVDVARLRAPGAELKEAFIPYGAVWASLGVTDTFNIEAFYQYRWEQTLLPVPGSYFSTNDFAGEGGQYNNVQLGFTGNPDIDADFLIAGLNQVGDMMRTGDPATQAAAAAMYMAYPTKVTLRAPGDYAEQQPKDGGQYGLRFTWYVQELNDTEFSLYYMNYHSRRPLFSGKTADFSAASVGSDLGYLAQNTITMDNLYDNLGAFSQVKLAYPEDIKLYAMSFNSFIGTTAIAGEITFRQDEPLQIDDVELLFAAMPQQLANAGLRPDLDGISQMQVYGPGEQANGYILSDTVQAQMTLTQLFGPTFGADQFTGLFEIGGVNINDMPDPDVLRLNSPGNARSGGFPIKNGLELGVQNGVETNPFPDDFSWGYRILAQLEYDNVFAGINIFPRLVFSHDVKGTTPDPLFLFVEDRKSMALGVNFDYQSRWSANFTYNSFWGGAGSANALSDRDYVSFNIKYSI
jgi:uncharacterized protein DUF1302